MAKKKSVSLSVPLARPQALGATYELKTPADVDAAMNEIGWLLNRQAVVQSQYQELLDAVLAKRPKMFALKIDEQATSIEERLEGLRKAIDVWAADHLKANLERPDDRTLKLEHGQVSYRKLEMSIEPQEGLDDKKVLERFESCTKTRKLPGLLTRAQGIFAEILCSAVNLLASDLVIIVPKLNREGMLAAYKAGRLDDQTLQRFGLRKIDGQERFSHKVH